MFAVLIVLAIWAIAMPFALAEEPDGAEQVTNAQLPDTTPPVIPIMANLTVGAVDASGTLVTYALPLATDDRDVALTPVCSPASGSLFPIGTTSVYCSATDAAGNRSEAIAFSVTVSDVTAPLIAQPANIRVTAGDESGSVVHFDTPAATDAVSGALVVNCLPASGSLFPIGSTDVTCTAQDAAGNAASISFTVTVDAPVAPEPSATGEPAVETTPEPTETPTPDAIEPLPSPTVEQTPVMTPTPSALALPWPPPAPMNPIFGSGPIEGLSLIWGGLAFPVSQEWGHTLFSLSQPTLYLYGADFGLDGRAHTGLDIGMARGTYLYSPVNGTVVAAGGTGGFGFYGNTLPGVGELRIQTEEGHQVILGHMSAIAVAAGSEVTIGQFVGLSGGDNGDHLHLETREYTGTGHVLVDPRQSFLIAVLTGFNATPEVEESALETVVGAPEESVEFTNQADTGISDGNGTIIPNPEIDEAREEDEPAAPPGSLLLETLINVPAVPMEAAKRSAAESLFTLRRG